VLADLTAGAVQDARERSRSVPLGQLERRAESAPAPRDAVAALARGGGGVRIIAEVKRASPSRGDLAPITDPAELAMRYAAGGASAVSVLTEGRRFKGSLADLEAVRAAVTLPVLRKDFIATEYQVLEARAAGADMVLLIVAALTQEVLQQLYDLVVQLGMTPLVEVHSPEELARAADLGARLIGVNARDLTTFDLDRDLFGRLAPLFPADAVRVAESAVTGPGDVARYRAHGADAVLVGEALVTSDPVATLRSLRAAGA